MYELKQTDRHTRLSIGHACIASGLFLFLILSILLSAVSSIRAVAFGASVISDMSNSSRQSNGLHTLTVNSMLSTAAQNKANAMVTNDYFEHTAPDGTTGWDYIYSTGYSFISAGENLAASNEDDAAVVQGWLDSSTHRANLLSSTFTEVGYGIAFRGDFQGYNDVYFIVALYALPKPAEPVVVASPPTQAETQPPAPDATTPDPVVGETVPQQEVEAPSQDPEENIEATEPSGTTALSENNFSLNSRVSLGILSIGTGLSVSGIALEAQRLTKHFRRK